MRPGQEAPDDLEHSQLLGEKKHLASMRPGQEAPDDPSIGHVLQEKTNVLQ